MNMQAHRTLPWYSLAFAVFAADQVAKTTIDAITPLGWSYPVTAFFSLVHVLNPGAAFSFLAGAGGWQRWFFLAIAIAASAWLIWMLRQTRRRSESLAFSLILGGALGNAFDRALRGHVIDYLDFHLAGWHWPAFNVADIAITLGAACLVLASFTASRQPQAQEKA
ncbi:signal peptidase II [Variovorax gossypii]